MAKRVLVTGGAGFIGSHVVDDLIAHGYGARVLDNLSPQVHGSRADIPEYINPEAEFIKGDIRDKEVVRNAVRGIDAVFHFAAAVGVGQSMYEPEEYTAVNTMGTAVLLKALIESPVEKLIVASSMSIYGEGIYRTVEGRVVDGKERRLERLKSGCWEMVDEQDRPLEALPTPEYKSPSLASVYALTKFDQERMSLMIGRAYDIPTVALRFFNVYGPGQALSNPYTGVLAIFASRYLNNRPPLIFEDGLQKRDFVNVRDVSRACLLSLESQGAVDCAVNIGSGSRFTVLEVAERLGRILGKEEIKPMVTGRYRTGDIRHCFANIDMARSVLGYDPVVDFEAGMLELSQWLTGRDARDYVETATAELISRGLTI